MRMYRNKQSLFIFLTGILLAGISIQCSMGKSEEELAVSEEKKISVEDGNMSTTLNEEEENPDDRLNMSSSASTEPDTVSEPTEQDENILVDNSSMEDEQDTLKTTEEMTLSDTTNIPTEDAGTISDNSSMEDEQDTLKTTEEMTLSDTTNIPTEDAGTISDNSSMEDEQDALKIAEEMMNSPDMTESIIDDSLNNSSEIHEDPTTLSDLNTDPKNMSTLENPTLLDEEHSTFEEQEKLSKDPIHLGEGVETEKESFSYFTLPGDTLSKIARKAYGKLSKWRELASVNQLKNPDRLMPGDIITIPLNAQTQGFYNQIVSSQKTEVTVEEGDTLSKISIRLFGTAKAWRVIYQQNIQIIQDYNKIFVGQKFIVTNYNEQSPVAH